MTLPPLRPARRALPLAALLLLGACSLFRASPGPPIPPEEDTPEHRACRVEARRSPEVLAVNRERNANNQWNVDRLEREGRNAFNRAYRDCLRARGLSPPGGVEAIVPR